MSDFYANTPKPPYYAVIFTSEFSGREAAKYDEISKKIDELSVNQPGYLGIESVKDSSGHGITISYWTDRLSILNWKKNKEHIIAQQLGKEVFYKYFKTRVTKVEKAYSIDDLEK